MNEHDALKIAIEVAQWSPCAKSQRGVVIWGDVPGGSITGFNHPPAPFNCDGSKECRNACNKVCIHAEMDAILKAEHSVSGCEILHVKVVDGEAVPSGPPSCWQCSRVILASGIRLMWLLHESGLRAYTAGEFHTWTLRECGLPRVLR